VAERELTLKTVPNPVTAAGVGCPATSKSTSMTLLPTGEKIFVGLTSWRLWHH
jgi:hypothetical protein